MKILALIPARGGSKRLPGKNIRVLGGKPLIVWSIDVAKGIPEIIDILVSTDDAEIADIASESGALVPWMRPGELATDTAASVAVALHALNWYESEKGLIDGLLLLQPTSPFRSRETVLNGIELFKSHEQRTVIGVSKTKVHPAWCFKINDAGMVPFIDGVDLQSRSQDLEPAYVVNGAFYLISPDDLRNNHSFYNEHMLPLVLDKPKESIDIDTEWDWRLAETVID